MENITHPNRNFPTVSLKLLNRSFEISGLAAEDPYFKAIKSEKENFEKAFVTIAKQVIKNDYICLDIGANIGLKSLHLAQLCPNGRVVAIEPGNDVVEVLRKNIGGSRLANIAVINAAITEKEGNILFSENSAYGHITNGGKNSYLVSGKTLNNLIQELNLKQIDFIKIDVEGYEFPILKSSLDLISIYNPLIFLEFNSWCQIAFFDKNPKEFLVWILDHFEYVFQVKKGRGESLLRRVTKSNMIEFLQDNLVFNGCVDDLLITNSEERLHTKNASSQDWFYNLSTLQIAPSIDEGPRIIRALRWAKHRIKRFL